MLAVVAKNYVVENRITEFIELTKELIESTRKEEGCIKYELFQDEKHKEIITFVEQWENNEALEKHFKSQHFLKIVPKLSDFLKEQSEVNIYNKLL